jgi:hypothetical protein
LEFVLGTTMKQKSLFEIIYKFVRHIFHAIYFWEKLFDTQVDPPEYLIKYCVMSAGAVWILATPWFLPECPSRNSFPVQEIRAESYMALVPSLLKLTVQGIVSDSIVHLNLKKYYCP